MPDEHYVRPQSENQSIQLHMHMVIDMSFTSRYTQVRHLWCMMHNKHPQDYRQLLSHVNVRQP